METREGTILTVKDNDQQGTLKDDNGGEIYNFRNWVLATLSVSEKVNFQLVEMKPGDKVAILKPKKTS